MSGWMWRFYSALYGYHYWRGVREALKSLPEWDRFERETSRAATPIREVDIDVAIDLPRLGEILDAALPDAATLRYRGLMLGRIDPLPGAEPLRAVHVRRELIENHSTVLLGCFLLERLDGVAEAERLVRESPRAHAPSARLGDGPA
jgi:hypothetical protein